MKNIHLIPTDKPSRLYEFGGRFNIQDKEQENFRNFNIYITSDEEIKEGQNYIEDGFSGKNKFKWHKSQVELYPNIKKDKIILTTDADLIKDGVQAIDDEFLEWFVKNPSCEFVEVEKGKILNQGSYITGNIVTKDYYEIIIPKEEPNYNMKQEILIEMERLEKEEPKKETLEEVAEYNYPGGDVWTEEQAVIRRLAFKNGAKWQQERMYSEEEVYNLLLKLPNFINMSDTQKREEKREWFEQFKKK